VDDTTTPSTAQSSTPVPAVDDRQKRQRRIKSDPGETPVITLNRLRVRAPKPIIPDRKKKKEELEAEIMSLLDQTHARRMAFLAAAAATATTAAATTTTSLNNHQHPSTCQCMRMYSHVAI
jgi:hypothetical protein